MTDTELIRYALRAAISRDRSNIVLISCSRGPLMPLRVQKQTALVRDLERLLAALDGGRPVAAVKPLGEFGDELNSDVG